MGVFKNLPLFGGRRPGRAGGPVAATLVGTAELDQSLRELAAMSSGRRWNVLPELRKAAKHLRTSHGLRMRRHVTPDGAVWPKATFKTTDRLPEPVLGRSAPIAGNSFYNLRWTKLTTVQQVVRSRELIEKLMRSRSGKSGEMKVPALFRPQRFGALSTEGSVLKYKGRKGKETASEIPVAGRLFAMLTKDRVAGSGTRIHAKGGSYELLYGLNADAARWARMHQYGGGTFRGKPVPARPFLGMNQADVATILRIFEKAKQRILAGRSSGSAAIGA